MRQIRCNVKKTLQILSFIGEHGNDNMKQVIDANYRQVKADVVHIVESEMERIKNDPDSAFDTTGVN